MKKTLVLAIAVVGSVAFGAGELDRALLIGTTDRNPFSYEIGDEVTFTIRFEYAKPFPEGEYVLDWLPEGTQAMNPWEKKGAQIVVRLEGRPVTGTVSDWGWSSVQASGCMSAEFRGKPIYLKGHPLV